MKKFVFALERVRRVREVEHDLALASWQEAETTAREARALCAKLRSEVDATQQELLARQESGDCTPAQALVHHARIDELGRKLPPALARAAAAERVSHERRELWIAARKELLAIEKLEVRRREAHVLESLRREELGRDELASVRAARESRLTSRTREEGRTGPRALPPKDVPTKRSRPA